MISYITKEMERLLSSHPLLVKLYNLHYRRLVRREICLAQITCKDTVLCIGGGPIPSTAMEIASKTGACVYVLDIDSAAVDISRSVVSKLGLADKIKISQGDGQNSDVREFSVIHIARQAIPHEKILKNILNKSSGGVRILIRTSNNQATDIHYLSSRCHCEYCIKIKQSLLLN